MKITMMLVDSAQAVNGKLYILGGGWSIYAPGSTMGIAVKIAVPWTETNVRHRLKIALFTEDENPVSIGERPVEFGGEFEVGRPPGIPQGIDLDVPLAFNLAPLNIQPGHSYVWRCSIDEKTSPEWSLAFHVAAPPSRGA